MKKIKRSLLTVCISGLIVGLGMYFPADVDSQTRACPKSSVKCKVSIEHPEHGNITIDSEKGKDEDAVIIE